MKVIDGSGNITTISPHRFDLFDPDLSEPLPWSYYSENAFIGKKVNVDMAGAIRAIEQLTGKQFIHVADLTPDAVVDVEEWKTSETLRLIKEETALDLEKTPWVEISMAEAYEEVDEIEAVQVNRTVTRYRPNLETMQVVPYETTVLETEEQATGRRVPQLKADVRFDEETGQFLRKRTIADVDIDSLNIPEVTLPQYVLDRIPAQAK